MSIYKNDFGTNVIQFGTGDIEVAGGRTLNNFEKEMYPCVIFTQQEDGEIGRRHPDYENIKNDPAAAREDAHTLFVFTDIRSIDVVINQLERTKERFKRNGTKVLSMQEITDEIEGDFDAVPLNEYEVACSEWLKGCFGSAPEECKECTRAFLYQIKKLGGQCSGE